MNQDQIESEKDKMNSLRKTIDEFIKEINRLNKQTQYIQKANQNQKKILKRATNESKVAYF